MPVLMRRAKGCWKPLPLREAFGFQRCRSPAAFLPRNSDRFLPRAAAKVTLRFEQLKHSKGRNSKLRPFQFLRVNRFLEGASHDACSG
jgi:hypothetical protein